LQRESGAASIATFTVSFFFLFESTGVCSRSSTRHFRSPSQIRAWQTSSSVQASRSSQTAASGRSWQDLPGHWQSALHGAWPTQGLDAAFGSHCSPASASMVPLPQRGGAVVEVVVGFAEVEVDEVDVDVEVDDVDVVVVWILVVDEVVDVVVARSVDVVLLEDEVDVVVDAEPGKVDVVEDVEVLVESEVDELVDDDVDELVLDDVVVVEVGGSPHVKLSGVSRSW
jgi:hypothetical protein